MSRSARTKLIAPAVLLACGLLLLVGQESAPPADARVLEAEGPLKWSRGNLHTHSLWSDGSEHLEMVARWYAEALARTIHEKVGCVQQAVTQQRVTAAGPHRKNNRVFSADRSGLRNTPVLRQPAHALRIIRACRCATS